MPSVSTLLAFDRWGVSYHAGYSADAAGWQIRVAACFDQDILDLDTTDGLAPSAPADVGDHQAGEVDVSLT